MNVCGSSKRSSQRPIATTTKEVRGCCIHMYLPCGHMAVHGPMRCDVRKDDGRGAITTATATAAAAAAVAAVAVVIAVSHFKVVHQG